jgi:hypothetical protein
MDASASMYTPYEYRVDEFELMVTHARWIANTALLRRCIQNREHFNTCGNMGTGPTRSCWYVYVGNMRMRSRRYFCHSTADPVSPAPALPPPSTPLLLPCWWACCQRRIDLSHRLMRVGGSSRPADPAASRSPTSSCTSSARIEKYIRENDNSKPPLRSMALIQGVMHLSCPVEDRVRSAQSPPPLLQTHLGCVPGPFPGWTPSSQPQPLHLRQLLRHCAAPPCIQPDVPFKGKLQACSWV